ncbi:MAG: hypothetical protein H6742_16255 [Alphaproteobacteria bacterium]|nr:hypothetical protein [Alphaproteobacteria bacterium]
MSASLLLALSTLAAPALAQDCDTKALTKEIADASPVAVGTLYVKLAQCDPAAAKKLSDKELLRVLPGDEGDAAAVAAVEIGATGALIAWTDAMISKDRSRTIAALGKACDSSKPVETFLIGAKASMGEKYWQERWFRALTDCSSDAAGASLAEELDKGVGADKTRFFGVLEVYSRSQGAKAIPKLQELAGKLTDGEGLTYIVNAFPDAANVGSVEGADPEAARAAVAAIRGLGPSLPPKAVDAARVALRSLGDEEAADAMAGERYRDLRREDGSFLWGAVAVESASCKKGKETWVRVHHGKVLGRGMTWPDQLQEKVSVAGETGWEFSLGEKCKSEATVTWTVPAEPFADADAYKAWRDEQLRAADKVEAAKRWTFDEEPIEL